MHTTRLWHALKIVAHVGAKMSTGLDWGGGGGEASLSSQTCMTFDSKIRHCQVEPQRAGHRLKKESSARCEQGRHHPKINKQLGSAPRRSIENMNDIRTCMCARACVRAWACTCVRACVCTRVRTCVHARACACHLDDRGRPRRTYVPELTAPCRCTQRIGARAGVVP